eukprot:148013-Pyramimonas_sp.AAC.1
MSTSSSAAVGVGTASAAEESRESSVPRAPQGEVVGQRVAVLESRVKGEGLAPFLVEPGGEE